MRTITVIETAEELLEAANRNRLPGDERPTLPENALLTFNESTGVIGLRATGFLMENVRTAEVVEVMAKALGMNVDIMTR